MRELQPSEKNEIAIKDTRSGSEVVFYYRTPTPAEVASYQARQVKRQGKKVVLNIYPTRLEFGLKVLTGFRSGDFGFEGKPVSSEPGSEGYREDWKAIVEKGAHDLVTTMARIVFENATVDESAIELVEELVEGEEAVPLAKS